MVQGVTYFRPLGGGLAALYFPVSRPIAKGESGYQPSCSAQVAVEDVQPRQVTFRFFISSSKPLFSGS
jgi:hypothetical protein